MSSAKRRKVAKFDALLHEVLNEEEFCSVSTDTGEGQQPTLEDAPSTSSSPIYIISVFIRGEITRRMVDIWTSKLCTFRGTIRVFDKFVKNATHVVVQSTCTHAQLQSWVNGFDATASTLDVIVIRSSWIIDSIKAGHLVDCSQYMWDKQVAEATVFKISSTLVNDDAPVAAELPPLALVSNQHPTGTRDIQDSGSCSPVKKDSGISKLLWVERNRDKFACSISGTEAAATTQNNTHITDVFEQLQNLYELTGDDFRATVYKRSCATLAKLPHIQDVKQVSNIHGIGKSLLDKIDEILETGSLQKLESFNKNPKIQAIIALSGVWGIGPKTAESLMSKHGIMSVEDLRFRGKPYLSPQQLVGLQWYEEFNIRIPREEVRRIESIVVEHCARYGVVWCGVIWYGMIGLQCRLLRLCL